jgi:hypothetical protein
MKILKIRRNLWADYPTWFIKTGESQCADRVKIGKLNYHPSSINWKAFGEEAERICKYFGLDYYIKDSLREEMNK